MTRFAIYARYSSDRQHERSIDDQVRECRALIERRGGQVAEIYADYALSGANRNRPELMRLVSDAEQSKFHAVASESIDRLSRDQEDIAWLYKRLSFWGVKIVTGSEGEVSEMHIGLGGTMAALYLRQLAEKTRRGQRGLADNGRTPGGLSYGYKALGEGRRKIDPFQADVVRRIFTDYANGRSPRKIAADLNREGIPSARGGTWTASGIIGSRGRKNGILHNESYIGVLIWNRHRWTKDPDTGKRVCRPNPTEEWVTRDVPHMRIVDDDLWNRAHAVKRHYTPPKFRDGRRAPRLFSGLLRCGKCGGSATVIRSDRVGCSDFRQRGTCDNSRTIALAALERRVLAGVKDRLVEPRMIEKAMKAYTRERKRLLAMEAERRNTAEARLAEIERKIAGIVAAVEDGQYSPALGERLQTLEAEKESLGAELDAREENVIEILPSIASMYRKKIEVLETALQAEGSGADGAKQAIRALIDHINLYPGEKRGQVDIEIVGDLACILNLASDPEGTSALQTVAGARFQLQRTFPVTAWN